MTFYAEELSPGNYAFTTNTSGNLTTIAAGTYTVGNYSIVVNSSGLIIAVEDISSGIVYEASTDTSSELFGGDTFICRFALKRKHSFFNSTTFGLPDGTPIKYSLLANVAYPVYYFNTIADQNNLFVETLDGVNFPLSSPSDFIVNSLFPIWGNTLFDSKNFFRTPKYSLDCYTAGASNQFTTNSIEGIMYLYYYGIISFIGESDINTNFRDIGQNLYEDFYPHQSDLAFWLQEKNVAPSIDNSYIYDFSYSKQPTESFNYLNDENFKGAEDCKTARPQRVIYSSQASEIDDASLADNFLINKALDFYDFSKKDGKLVSIEGLEGNRVLVRQENNSSIYNAYIEINTSQDTALLSAGNVFANKPVEFSKPSLGYFGSQHKAILHTPFGHVSVDAKRGLVFLLGNGAGNLEEISNQGMKHWFKENLPFHINKYFPDKNIDSSYSGIGLLLCYDNRFNTFYLTKLDYSPKSEDVKYNSSLDKFYLESTDEFISLKDRRYFSNRSFTISYNFYTKSWTSFHSFLPEFYIEQIDSFISGTQNLGLWTHNVTNKSYQTFYGRVFPFIVEVISKGSLVNNLVKDVSFFLDVFRYMNESDAITQTNVSFDEAVVYNKEQNSGLLELNLKTRDLRKNFLTPILLANKKQIGLEIKDGKHSFNQFSNILREGLNAFSYDAANVMKHLNIPALRYLDKTPGVEYLKSSQFTVRLSNTKETRYQFIFKGLML